MVTRLYADEIFKFQHFQEHAQDNIYQEKAMEIVTEDICKILHYTITERRMIDNGKAIDTYYFIKNENGDIFSQNYNDIEDPFEILLSMERMVLNTITRNHCLEQNPSVNPDFS